MICSTCLPQLSRKLWVLTSLSHNGRGKSRILAGSLWDSKPLDIGGKRSYGSLRLLAQSKRFVNGSFPPAVLGSHHVLRSIVVTYLLEVQVPSFRRLSVKGNFSVAAFSPEDLSDETPKEDLASFRPPPRAPPVTPQELLAEVPFHYWYSYADFPDNSSRKEKTRAKESKHNVTSNSDGNSDRFSLRTGEPGENPVAYSSRAGKPSSSLMNEIEDVSLSTRTRAEEPGRSLIRELRKRSALADEKQEKPRRSLMRESTETTGSSLISGERRRSLMRKPGLSWDKSSSRQGEKSAAIDSVIHLTAGKRRDLYSEMVSSQGTTEIGENDVVARIGPAETTEVGDTVRNSIGELDEEHKRVAAAGNAGDAGLEKEAFRLSKKEINLLVDKCNRSNRQINMGWRGWGHNYITLVHSYWKKSEVCKIKCKGAVTLDMDFLCNKLEEKTGGRVIHRNVGVVYLYRGRDYDPKFAPKLPVMRQRKKTPAKRLSIPFGLTKEDVNAMRARGKELPALCKLAKNGVYVTLLDDIRRAFETSDLVRVNCQGFEARNFRALGAKLKKLVPCVLISYEFEHILMWRWDGYKAPSPEDAAILAEESFKDDEEDVEE